MVHPVHDRDGNASAPRKSTSMERVEDLSRDNWDLNLDGPGDVKGRAFLQYAPGLLSDGHVLHVRQYPPRRPEIP